MVTLPAPPSESLLPPVLSGDTSYSSPLPAVHRANSVLTHSRAESTVPRKTNRKSTHCTLLAE